MALASGGEKNIRKHPETWQVDRHPSLLKTTTIQHCRHRNVPHIPGKTMKDVYCICSPGGYRQVTHLNHLSAPISARKSDEEGSVCLCHSDRHVKKCKKKTNYPGKTPQTVWGEYINRSCIIMLMMMLMLLMMLMMMMTMMMMRRGR